MPKSKHIKHMQEIDANNQCEIYPKLIRDGNEVLKESIAKLTQRGTDGGHRCLMNIINLPAFTSKSSQHAPQVFGSKG